MKSDADTSRPIAGGEALEKAILQDRVTGCALLCALLDAEVLFQEDGVPVEELSPLWNLYCRECAPEEEAEYLGLAPPSEAGVCALAISEELGDLPSIARSSNSLGLLKRNKGHWDDALEHYQHSLHILEAIGDTEGLATAHTNIGNVYIDRGAWDQADNHLRQSLKIAQQIAHPFELAQVHLSYGRLYLMQTQFQMI